MAVALATGTMLTIGMAPASANVASTPTSESAVSYELSVGGESTTLAEGQSVVYPMVPTDPDAGVVYPGDYGTITVTAAGGVYHYDIAMSVPVTNFIGAFSIMDLTSGLSGGSVTELIFSGDVPTSRLRNHTYPARSRERRFLQALPLLTQHRTTRRTPTTTSDKSGSQLHTSETQHESRRRAKNSHQ
ncbi:hypothetical protein [Subtercola boreus]|uniref:hypothetical protein n=1 Tax=Subtercola boreus TaxID=120213 RepID=UPI0011C05AC4|nr:hypothetical protein [Subtercola boreus]